jgi:hypothetical protein
MASVGRTLFVAMGGFWTLIGILTGVLTGRGIGPAFLFVSEPADAALFGEAPGQILLSNQALTTFRYVALRALAGLLVAAGLLTMGLAWFGLREARIWPLVALTVVGVAVLPYWWISLAPYRAAGIRLGLGDIPPFMWLPALLMPLASVLSWVAQIRS